MNLNTYKSRQVFYYNGNIYLGVVNGQPLYAIAIMTQDDKITEVFLEKDDVKPLPQWTQVNLNGALMLPGLCDAHLHLTAGGKMLGIADLSEMGYADVKETLQRHFNKDGLSNGRWFEAFNWDIAKCELNADIIEDIIPNIPVVVFKRDLHGCCVNRTALKLLNVTRDTEDPEGGIIERDADGEPTGMLFETASVLVWEALPQPTPEFIRDCILKGQKHLIAMGNVAVCEVLEKDVEKVYYELDEGNELKIIVDGWLRVENWERGTPPPKEGKRFRITTLKFFLDGSFGSKSAALMTPYVDQPDNTGELFYSDEELYNWFKDGIDSGWRIAMHAIGNRGVKQAIRVIKSLPQEYHSKCRIEHLEMITDEDLIEIEGTDMIVSLQPIHLLDDWNWLCNYIGEDACRETFRLGELFKKGVTSVYSSDWPVAPPNPIVNLHVAVNMHGLNGVKTEFRHDDKVEPQQAIFALTEAYAIACGYQSKDFGRIVVGSEANFTVVNNAPLDLIDWSNANVAFTVIRGEIFSQKNVSLR